ncbi:MAG: DNA-binding protein WhiA [Microbacteriaceae bacterium]|nr:DNA-binding protein WhiA [Microbacteriaceae bacterium]
MSPTTAVRHELVKVVAADKSIRHAELAAALRVAGGLHVVNGRVTLEAEFHTPQIVQRMRKTLVELYNTFSEAKQLPHGSLKPGDPMFLVSVNNGDVLARRLGLTDQRHRPIKGMPNRLTTGSREELAASLRGAFLARGTLSAPGRSASLEITCPTPEVAMALVGAAARFEVPAKNREIRNQFKVLVRDIDGIAGFLAVIGATETMQQWRQQRKQRETRATANRLVNFDDANLRRSAQASVAACARVERAFEILGDEVPENLRIAGELRLQYREASLDELGSRANPQTTKDAIAGRIRRLLSLADKKAKEQGIPGTEASLS